MLKNVQLHLRSLTSGKVVQKQNRSKLTYQNDKQCGLNSFVLFFYDILQLFIIYQLEFTLKASAAANDDDDEKNYLIPIN